MKCLIAVTVSSVATFLSRLGATSTFLLLSLLVVTTTGTVTTMSLYTASFSNSSWPKLLTNVGLRFSTIMLATDYQRKEMMWYFDRVLAPKIFLIMNPT